MQRILSVLSSFILVVLLSMTGSAKAELVGYWAFDGDLKDAGPGKNDAVAKTGKPEYAPQVPKALKSTQALSLTEKTTVNIPHKAGLLDGKTLTISFWVNAKSDSPGLWSRVISKTQRIENGSVGLEIQRNAQTEELHYRFDTQLAINQHGPIGKILDGNWHHILITVDGKAAITYVDGKPNTRNIRTDLETPLANTSDLIIGQSGIENQRFFTGMIDDLAVWDTLLTAEQVKSLHDGSKTPLEIK